MSNDPVSAMEALRKRVEKVADECELDVRIFSLNIKGGEDMDKAPTIQMIFAVRPNAVKSAAQLEQEKFDAQFADIEASFNGPAPASKPEDEAADHEELLKDLGNWMEGYKDE